MSVMSRTKAREIALHLIFEMGFQQFEEENLNERLDEEIMKSISGDIALYAGKLSEEQTAYIRAVVKGVANDLPVLDTIIEANSKGWSLNRLSHMTIAVLRLALFEMRDVDDVPVGVASTRPLSWRRSTTPRMPLPSSTACSALPPVQIPAESRRAPMPERFLGLIRPTIARRRRFTTPRLVSGSTAADC